MAKYFSMDGYVCGEIEQQSTATGKIVIKFSVNSPDRRKVGDEWKTIPQYFRCQYWLRGDRDYRAAFIDDGAHLQLSGQPRFEEWEGKNGKRSLVRFNVEDLFLIAPRGTAPQARQETTQYTTQETYDTSVYDSDIPF